MEKVLLIDGSNFVDFPKGGQLSFCNQLIEVFPEGYFKLIGLTTNRNHKIGLWQYVDIKGKEYEFFPLYYLPKGQIKRMIPERLRLFFSLIRYKKSIFQNKGQTRIFSNTPEALIAVNFLKRRSIILHFLHGVENPLAMPRYKWGKLLKSPFWKLFINSLSNAEFLAATADEMNLKNFMEMNFIHSEITSFPTRFDDKVFKNQGLPKSATPTFVYCGRINKVKGWELLIDGFADYKKRFGEGRLVVLGDGEDRAKLERKVIDFDLEKYVTISGFINKFEIVGWLNKANVFLLPSYNEGWPIAMVEALACGLSVVATNVSGTNDMIKEGVNGYVVNSRNPEEFAQAMSQAINLETPNQASISIAGKYKASDLKKDLIKTFPCFFYDLKFQE
jgi:glycosyltransferase involved in cell wall biosynthesis